MQTGRLTDKVAIITGGSKGIGAATARKFVAEGANVIIWDMDEENGEKLVLELNSLTPNNPKADFFLIDVSKLYAIEYATKQVLEIYQKIDILINNAGIVQDATLLKMQPEEWSNVLDVNLTGVFYCTKTIASHMAKAGSGRIINASSVVGIQGNFGQSNYAAAKAGVIGLTKVWARELGPKGITVNAVAPGFIQTDMIANLPDKILQTIRDRVPLMRVGMPEDIANAYCFLASDEAAFINGAVLNVDGGISI